MQIRLVLHQITAMDVPPPDFAHLAAQAGCEWISVFTNCPDAILPGQTAPLSFPTITSSMMSDIRLRLDDTGVRVSGIEYFPILPDHDVTDYLPGLVLGAELGASRAVTHIHDTEPARAVEAIGKLCELAAAYGISVGVEFTPMTHGCPSLDHAVRLVDQVGRADFAIGVDCLHLIRSGGTAAHAARLPPAYFSHGQLCDGHGLQQAEAYMSEAHDRELPGRGDFPLDEIMSALPQAVPIEIEVPSARSRTGDVSPLEHIASAVACSRAVLERVMPL